MVDGKGMEQLLKDWTAGADEFNAGRFWHAHEEWEKGWRDLPERTKLQIQAAIQVAAVFVHLEKGRPGPAVSLARLALEKFERVGELGRIEGGYPRLEIPGAEKLLKAMIQIADADQAAGRGGRALRWGDWEARARGLRARVFEPG